MIKSTFARLRVWLRKRYSRYSETEADATKSVLTDFGKSRGANATIFVVGANNGIENDPFVHQALKFGWSAVLIEPNPRVFSELHRVFAGLPRIKCVNAAIGKTCGSLLLYTIAFSTKRWATGLASASEETLLKHFGNGWVQAMCERFQETLPTDPAKWVRPIEVPCKTIEQVASETGLKDLDILAVDTEGMDAEIVNNALDGGYRPEVICWEHRHLSHEANTDLIHRCEALGYHVQNDTNNVVCRRSCVPKRVKV
jgi:FkbM family methyltransferase